MGVEEIPDRLSGQTILDTFFNIFKSVLKGNLVPRNTDGVAVDQAGDLGEDVKRWRDGWFARYLNLGDAGAGARLYSTGTHADGNAKVAMQMNEVDVLEVTEEGLNGAGLKDESTPWIKISERMKYQDFFGAAGGFVDWSRPEGVEGVFAILYGAGGGGGGGGYSSQAAGGGGGAGGGRVFGYIPLGSDSGLRIYLPAGGAGGGGGHSGAPDGANGGDGQEASIVQFAIDISRYWLRAPGGKGGTGGAGGASSPGGAGGASSTNFGVLTVAGGAGGASAASSADPGASGQKGGLSVDCQVFGVDGDGFENNGGSAIGSSGGGGGGGCGFQNGGPGGFLNANPKMRDGGAGAGGGGGAGAGTNGVNGQDGGAGGSAFCRLIWIGPPEPEAEE